MIKSTKRAHRSNKKNIFVALMLAAALAITGAFAYLTAQDSAENKFTVGNVDIELTEPNWNASNGENIVAGQVFAKDPTIKNTGANDAYVYMLVEIPKAYSTSVVDEAGVKSIVTQYPLFSFTANEGWELINSQVASATNKYENEAFDYYLYGHTTALEPNEEATLFNEVTFANITEDFIDDTGLQSLDIKVTGYAIQSNFYSNEANSAASAWELYVNQNNWKWPVNPYSGTTRNYYSFIGYSGTPVQSSFYSSADDEIVVPEALSSDFGENGIFGGWRSQTVNGELSPNQQITVEDLYVRDAMTREILNPNPEIREILTDIIIPGDGSNLPVKLMPKDDTCLTVIDRGGVAESNYDGLDDSETRLYGEPTTEYPYTYENDDDWYVYGLAENITVDILKSSYVRVQGKGYAKVTTSYGDYTGTGAKIDVYTESGALVESFYIVIFGDLNGDATVDSTDVSIVAKESLSPLQTWSDKTGNEYKAYLLKAGNIRKDSVINQQDVTQVYDHSLNAGTINQVTGLIEYKD